MKFPWFDTIDGFILLAYTKVPKEIIHTNYSEFLCERENRREYQSRRGNCNTTQKMEFEENVYK